MMLTIEEVLSLAAGELLAIRREPVPIRLRCRPKLPTAPGEPKPIKARHVLEQQMLSQTSELVSWWDQLMPSTSLAPLPKQVERSPKQKPEHAIPRFNSPRS